MGIRTSEDDDIVSRHVGGYVFLWDVVVVVIDVGVGWERTDIICEVGDHFLAKSSMAFQPSLPSIIRYSHL